MAQKKIGIVCDNYKLPKFKKALKAKGYAFSFKPFTPDSTAITIKADESKIDDIGKLCKELELGFKRSN